MIARQGEPADSLFILARGRVGVFDDSAGGTGARDRLATLEAPNVFGEMGLLTGQARGATVVAEDEVLCYRLDKAGLRRDPEGAPGAGRGDCRASSPRGRRPTMRRCRRCPPTCARASAPTRAADLVRRIKKFFAIES